MIGYVKSFKRKERCWIFYFSCWFNELVQVLLIEIKNNYIIIINLWVLFLFLFLSVLDLDAFERNTKAEGLGVGSEGAAGEKNMHDAEFTCTLFRFIQLTCEGHNLGIISICYFIF